MTSLLSRLFNLFGCLFLFFLLVVNTQPAFGQTESTQKKKILFLGNSLTAGYGINKDQAFPALIQARLDSLNWPYLAINAGLSGETSAGGLRRIDWLLRSKVDVLVLSLGANDGLRGTNLSATEANLKAIITKVRKKYPSVQVVLSGMEVPPNMGADYSKNFRNMFKTISEEMNTALIPFLLEGVGGIPSLNLADGIHPTPQGHQIVAETVWETLSPVLENINPELSTKE